MEKRFQIAMFHRDGAWDGCVIDNGKLSDVFTKLSDADVVTRLIPFFASSEDGKKVTFDVTVQEEKK